MATVSSYQLKLTPDRLDPDWCPGCGDFGVLKAVKMRPAKRTSLPKTWWLFPDWLFVEPARLRGTPYGVHSLHAALWRWLRGSKLANTDSQGGHYGRRR